MVAGSILEDVDIVILLSCQQVDGLVVLRLEAVDELLLAERHEQFLMLNE